MLGTIPGAGNTAVNKADQKLSLHGAHILVDGKPNLYFPFKMAHRCEYKTFNFRTHLPLWENR